MAHSDETLGGRLPLLDKADISAKQTPHWDAMSSSMGVWAEKIGFASKTPDGRFIGPFNPMLRSPDLAQSFLQLQLEEQKKTDLADRVRQVVILSVGSAWKSPYELYAHSAAARAAGFSETCVAALAAGQPSPELDHEEQIAQSLALALTARHAVGGDLYADALWAFGEEGLADFAILAGCYDLICGLLNLFEIPAP